MKTKGNLDLERFFVIIAEPRSGSSYLCDYLDKVDSIDCHSELFFLYAIHKRTGVVNDFRQVVHRHTNIRHFMSVIAQESGADKMIGFKWVMWQDFRILWWVWRGSFRQAVVLGRRNKLAQFASLMLVAKTRRWQNWGEGPILEKVRFSAIVFLLWFIFVDFPYRINGWILRYLGCNYIKLYYEDIVEEENTVELENYLNITFRNARPSNAKRLNNRVVLERFSNPGYVSWFVKLLGKECWLTS